MSGPDKVTSQDVAKRAGVSQSAVSRVFTPGASASKGTVEKVRHAALELGYRPNVLARSLITGRSRIIGLVVAYLENQFYPEAVERLSVALQAKGYHVLVFMAAPTVGDVDAVMQEILDYQVDGIVLASVSMSSSLASQCAAFGIPVVLFNRDQDDDRLSSVTTDNRAGGRALAEHLTGLGHNRIAYLAGFEGASTQRDREAGFREGLAAAGQAALRPRDRQLHPCRNERRHPGHVRPPRPPRRRLRLQRPHGLRRDGRAALTSSACASRKTWPSSASTTCRSPAGPPMTSPPSASGSTAWSPRPSRP